MAAPEWTAEIALGLADARALIGAQFPALQDAQVVPYGNGWDNTAYLVDDRYVFRFPRRAIAGPLMAREIAILPLLAPALPAAITAPIYAGRASDSFPWPFAGYERIQGTTACDTDVRAASLPAALGAFLRALHAIEPEAARSAGLPPDEMGRLHHAKRLPMAAERLGRLHAAGLVPDPSSLVAHMTRIAPTPGESTPCIVHGDLYARHVVLDARGALAGVIDWGDLHRGDPALDLAAADLLFDARDRRAFDGAYGPIDARTRERARWRAIYHAAMTTDYGMRVGDQRLVTSGIAALARMREEAA